MVLDDQILEVLDLHNNLDRQEVVRGDVLENKNKEVGPMACETLQIQEASSTKA